MLRIFQSLLYAAALAITNLPATSQLDAIHTESLPISRSVSAALEDLREVGAYGHLFLERWDYPVAKDAIAKRITDDFDALYMAARTEPTNRELRLLAALSGRFAYNLDVQRVYLPTQKLLEQTIAQGGDFRATWFLGMLECQSNDVNGGMAKMLDVEKNTPHLPGAFWRDYGICALQANMPQHASRAFDTAEQDNAEDSIDKRLAGIARNGYEAYSASVTYEPRKAWSAEQAGGGTVRFTSTLCGVSFAVKGNAGIDARPVSAGKCVVSITPAGFDTHKPHHSPTLLLMVVPAPPNESLEEYIASLTRNKYGEPLHPIDLPCPVATCIASEFQKGDMYADAGGAHLLSVALQSVETPYPQLVLEEPDGPPSGNVDRKYFRPVRRLHRLSGRLYVVALMDASASIYDKGKDEYVALLRSIRVDAAE